MSKQVKARNLTKGRSVKLQQMLNLRYVSQETWDKFSEAEKQQAIRQKIDTNNQHLYKVVSLKNTVDPVAGAILTAAQVQALIDDGVEVNIQALGD